MDTGRATQTSRMQVRTKTLTFGITFLVIGLILTAGVGLSVGSSQLPFSHALSYLLYHIPGGSYLIKPNWTDTEASILSMIRMPRVILGMLVGASLSLAGVVFQGVLRNPLSDPYILGVSSGASVGAASMIVIGGSVLSYGTYAVPLMAFVGAFVAVAMVFAMGRIGSRLHTETLILSGVVVNSFLGAVLIFLLTMRPPMSSASSGIVLWLLGSLAMRGWDQVWVLVPVLILTLGIAMFFRKDLNVLSLGERSATSLGIHVEAVKWILLLSASLAAATAVSASGIIGFVGLIVPHMVRLIVGPDHRLVIPFATFTGAIFLVWCDTISRTILAPTELSIGVVTAALGAPFFAYLLRTQRKGAHR